MNIKARIIGMYIPLKENIKDTMPYIRGNCKSIKFNKELPNTSIDKEAIMPIISAIVYNEAYKRRTK